jgi:cytochrome c556
MASKLRHAQEAMAAVVQADFEAIEAHAIALQRISAASMTLPQDTVTYSVLAEQFREVAGALASRAAARDLDGVTASYLELSGTCVACHSQINRERLLRDFPGQVSRRMPAALEPLEGADS